MVKVESRVGWGGYMIVVLVHGHVVGGHLSFSGDRDPLRQLSELGAAERTAVFFRLLASHSPELRFVRPAR